MESAWRIGRDGTPLPGNVEGSTFVRTLAVTTELSLLYRTYDAFNARDIQAVLDTMTDDVDWPNGWEGGHVLGREAVREHWTRQWQTVHPTMVPKGYTRLNDGRLRLEVHQVVRSIEGNVLADATVGHIYTFRDGLIAKMEIE